MRFAQSLDQLAVAAQAAHANDDNKVEQPRAPKKTRKHMHAATTHTRLHNEPAATQPVLPASQAAVSVLSRSPPSTGGLPKV